MKKKEKKSSFSRNMLLGGAVATASLVAGSVLYLQSGKQNKMVPQLSYHVEKVFDGDTFQTVDKLRFRLASLDAPELEFCGGDEAKKTLEDLIVGKPLYIKIVYTDMYQRLDSLVYTDDGFVNEKMLASGWVQFNDRAQVRMKELKKASERAIQRKKGIYGKRCTQEMNPDNAKCNIKGNNPQGSRGEKIYHMPGCANYNIVRVQRYAGDEWFCTENEAIRAGYTKPATCP